jgi:hypothetical protein
VAPRERNLPYAEVPLQAAAVPAAAPAQAEAVAALGRSHHRRLPARRPHLHPALLHDILPSFLDDLGNINLAIGFSPLIVGLLLATRWT